MRLKWKCLSGLAPLKPVIGLGPVWGWPVAPTCHSSCLTLSHKTMHVKTGDSCFTPQRFSLPRHHSSLAPEAGCYDKKACPHCWKWQWQITACRCVWQRQHNLFYRDTRGDLPLICCDLIQSDTTNLHPLHLPKTFNPYLSCYKPYLDANRKLFLPRRWLFKDAWRL